MSGVGKRTTVVKPAGPVFRAFHDFFLPLIESDHSNMMVAQFQRYTGLQSNGKVTNRFLNIVFRLASTMGEEIFGAMPLLFWYALPLSLPFATNFVFLILIGQLIKDFVMLPRPVGNCDKWKIVKLDPTFDTEFGMPSSHTMTGYLPVVVVQSFSRMGFSIPLWAWGICIIYLILVGLSRLYLGVHSVYDVIGGAILGLIIILATDRIDSAFTSTVYTGASGIYIILVLFLLFVTAYPKPTKAWSASYGTSAQVFGTWMGVAASIWYIFQFNATIRDALVYVSLVPCDFLYSNPAIGYQPTTNPEFSTTFVVIGRFLVAATTAALVKVAAKPIFVKLFTFLIKAG